MGEFAFADHKSFEYVKSNNIISFFDAHHPHESYIRSHYANKQVRVRKNGKTFTVRVLDTCADSDCDGCCTKNSHGGFLIDMEAYTAINNLGSDGAADGKIEW